MEDSVLPQPAACAPTEGGCRRCQSTAQVAPDGAVFLLLAAQNAHAQEALRRELDTAQIPFQLVGDVAAVPTPRARLAGSLLTWLEGLPEATAQAVQAVFFAGSLDCPQSAVSAFVRAQPVPALLADAPHEWVRDALDEGWLFSVFHPIIDAHDGGVFAYEALIRARNPHTQAPIGAGPLISAAGRLHLDHVLDQAARRAAIGCAAALHIPDVRYFINFLPNTIYDPEICLRTTMEAAHQHALDPARLVFEVVETERIPDMGRLRRILDYYRSRGVGTAVDDMGAGHASLQYLTELRPDFVKLDRDLVVRAEQDPSARRDMDMIIAKAKQLGISVIAEGIETPAHSRLCTEAGVDYMQGFLFARPANPPEVLRAGLPCLPDAQWQAKAA